LAAITQLCRQGLLLRKGRIIAQGTASEVVAQYLAAGRVSEGRSVVDNAGNDDAPLRFSAVAVAPIGKEPSPQIDRDDGVEVTIEYDVDQAIPNCQITLELWNYSGVCVLTSGVRDAEPSAPRDEAAGRHVVSCRVPSQFLRAGMYSIGLEATTVGTGPIAAAADVLSFEVVDLSPPEAKLLESENGVIRPPLEWTHGQSSTHGDA
jgi:hypothetical protein